MDKTGRPMLNFSSRDLSLACFSAILLILSFPKFDLDLLAWFSLVPLLVALEGKDLKQTFLLSYITGLIFFTGIFYWITTIPANLIDYLLVQVIYLPQYLSLWGLGLNWIRKRTGLSVAIVAPSLWVILEYIRSHLSFLSLPWMLLGHSQYLHPSLIQITSITGVYGLSFLIVLVNAVIYEVVCYIRLRLSRATRSSELQKFPLASIGIVVILIIATVFYGLFIISKGVEGGRLKIALVQGNIPTERKWDRSFRQEILNRYAGLTRDAAKYKPALIIWPETAVPEDIQHNEELKRWIEKLAIELKTHLLVGSGEFAKFTDRSLLNKYFDSMVLLSPEGKIEGVYRKIRLVPFGEYEPLQGIFTWPKAIASTMGNTLPGDQYTLFTLRQATFGAMICWENIFPDLFREFVKQGAHFMVSASNEGWFGDTAAPYQLLAMSVFRGVENRVAIARASNNGISTLIDPYGRITDRLRDPEKKELFIEGILIGDITISNENTFYTQYGDLFAFLQIFFCIFFISYSWLGKPEPRLINIILKVKEGEER